MVCRPPARKAGMRVTRKQRICHPPAKQVKILLSDGKRGGIERKTGLLQIATVPFLWKMQSRTLGRRINVGRGL